jgi:hypothetical protein
MGCVRSGRVACALTQRRGAQAATQRLLDVAKLKQTQLAAGIAAVHAAPLAAALTARVRCAAAPAAPAASSSALTRHCCTLARRTSRRWG